LANPAGVVVNLPELTANAKFTGHINYDSDADGTVRWSPLVMKYNGLFFPSADVQAVRLYKGMPHLALRTASYGITGLEIGDRFIATDESGRALIHYHGPGNTFPTFSVSDIYSGNISPDRLKNKIVLIGTTATGLGDIRLTPYGSSYPGVEIRANTIQNLTQADFIHRPGWMFIYDVAVILALGGFLVMVLPRIGVRNAIWLTLALLVAYATLAFGLFRSQHIWLNVVYPSLLMLVLFMSSTIFKYFTAETEKRQIKGAFQHYVPMQVVEQIMKDIDNLSLGGEKRELTVLFSDIRGFASIAETLAPEELVKLLNVYLTQMTDKVFKHNGLLDKYIGDAIMAVYGAPIHHPDHAKLACRTALEMMQAMQSLRDEWKKSGFADMDIGIGINTGSMVVGNMGSKGRFDYTVIGDAVNLGSRIESLNKTYGTHILMSEFTYRQVRDEFPHIREIDITQVKGRQEIVRIYELMLPWQYPHMNWLRDFARAYELFRAGLTGKARAVFEQLYKTTQDPVSNYYAQRCKATRRKGGAISL
jgi:adenylate cyclase